MSEGKAMIVSKIEMLLLLLLYPWDLFHLELYLFVRTNLHNKRWIGVMASYFINQVKPEEVNYINSSVVMKYFVNDRFRLLYFLIATKGAACRELYM